jgi:hypothetical protein
MAEALGKVNMRWRELLRRRWWSVGSKSLFDQMAAPARKLLIYVILFTKLENVIRNRELW